MNQIKLHLFHGQIEELISEVPIESVMSGRLEERTDYFSELVLEMNLDEEITRHFTDNNRLLLHLPNSEYREFVIYEPDTDHHSKAVRFSASYLELDKMKIIRPVTHLARTNLVLLADFLQDTEWNVGEVQFAGIQPYTVEKHIGVYSAIRAMADFFNLQVHFRIEYENGKIMRYVDMAFDFGSFKGVELTDDNGLVNVSVKENTDIITALLCVAENDTGTKFEVIVTDEEARSRYGRNGNHQWGLFDVSETGLTKYQVQLMGEKELVKRSKKTIEVSSDQVDLYALTGNEYERLDLHDFVRLISHEHKPTLRMEARVIGMVQNITDTTDRQLTLGEFIEYE